MFPTTDICISNITLSYTPQYHINSERDCPQFLMPDVELCVFFFPVGYTKVKAGETKSCFFFGLGSNKNSPDYVLEEGETRYEKVNITN